MQEVNEVYFLDERKGGLDDLFYLFLHRVYAAIESYDTIIHMSGQTGHPGENPLKPP